VPGSEEKNQPPAGDTARADIGSLLDRGRLGFPEALQKRHGSLEVDG
jgi:hypothetical protein